MAIIPDYDETIIEQLTALFRSVADATRLQIVLLVRDGERRSGEIAEALHMTPSAVSHQLRWLRDRRIVTGRKQGRETFYRLADDCIGTLVGIGLQHVLEEDHPSGTPPPSHA